MDLVECIINRWSCRAYKSDPVPQEIIQEVLRIASRSPSYTNTQPWEVAVVTGQKLTELDRKRNELIKANVSPNPDMPAPQSWPPAQLERSREFAAQRQEAMNQAKADAKSLYETTTLSSHVFGAPCLILLMIDRALPEWSIFDLGLFVQSLVLAAHSKGLGTCIQAGIVRYPDEVRKILGIPETKKLIVGVSIGYPYMESKVNALRTKRTDIRELTKLYT